MYYQLNLVEYTKSVVEVCCCSGLLLSIPYLRGTLYLLQVVTRVPLSTQDEMEAAVSAAQEALTTWSQTSVLTRQQVMFKYQQLIRDNIVRPHYAA